MRHRRPSHRFAIAGFTPLKTGLLALLLLVLGVGGILFKQAETIVLGAEAYLYGYPLVIMDVTRESTLQSIGAENQLHRVRQFPDARFKDVVRPNVDTLYTTAFIDMDKGPWVFEMAPNDLRYEVMPFMDAWTNVFAAPGTRSTGQGGGRFLLAGPKWKGEVPEGLQLLRAPTRMVWLIGRTQTNGIADYPVVHRLQDQLRLLPLADWHTQLSLPAALAQAGNSAALESKPQVDGVKPVPPIQQMRTMDTEVFFQRLTRLMVDNPPSVADAPMLLKMARIGLRPGQTVQWGALDRWSVSLGRWIADRKVEKELAQPRELVRGWATPPSQIGQYGTHYNIRAAVAMVGLGANLPADALYPNAKVDNNGDALNGKHRYRLHFAASQLPPVKAFWSVTAYGKDDFFIDNPMQRYALGNRDALVFNADGSLDLWLQAEMPEAAKKANWLPVPANEPFLLNARLYWPKPEALDGRWGMPAVERLD
jgi:hypothetical protein